MSRISPGRLLAIPVAAAAAVLFTIAPSGLSHSTASGVTTDPGVSAPDSWGGAGAHAGALPDENGVYEGQTDQTFLQHISQAKNLPQYTNKSWRAARPFAGVKRTPRFRSGAELFGPVGGIGTAIAIDPADTSGNTAYLGTHG